VRNAVSFSFRRNGGASFVTQWRCVVRRDTKEVRRFVVTQRRCVGLVRFFVTQQRCVVVVVPFRRGAERRFVRCFVSCALLRALGNPRGSPFIDRTLPPDNFLNNVEFPIQLTPLWCIALSYLESYGHYLLGPTGGPSNHVTVNIDIWSHFQQTPGGSTNSLQIPQAQTQLKDGV